MMGKKMLWKPFRLRVCIRSFMDFIGQDLVYHQR